MKKWTFLLAVFVSISALAQKSPVFNDKNAESRTVDHFHAITVSDGIDLVITYGDEAVAVSASDVKYRDKIRTVVENGTLRISYKIDVPKILFEKDRRLKAYVSYKQLDQLTASTGSDVKVDGTIKSDKLDLHFSAGSDFTGKVDVGDLKINQQSGSDINISGNANTIFIDATAGSDFKGYNLITDVATIEATGGSDIEITVNKVLSAKAHGGSDVNYKGNASVKQSDSGGASSISRKS